MFKSVCKGIYAPFSKLKKKKYSQNNENKIQVETLIKLGLHKVHL